MHHSRKSAWRSAARVFALSLNVLLFLAFAQLVSPVFAKQVHAPVGHQHTDENKKNVSTAITKVLQTQADAWNAGDLDKFMTAYLKSPDISFVSADGEQRGYDALEARYRKKYGTKRDTMGTLSFSNLRIQPLGQTNALCIGNWQVERKGQLSLQGIFSLVWTKTDGAWKIIHDHTSSFTAPVNK